MASQQFPHDEEIAGVKPGHRFRSLDGLRGIAALSVVIYHYTRLFGDLYEPKERLPISFPYGSYGVQLFFLISGFVIFMSARYAKGPGSFAVNRWLRLYPAYFVALTLAIVWGKISTLPGIQTTPFQDLINYTMLARLLRFRMVDGVYWSLIVEIFFYILIALLMWRFSLTDAVARRFSLTWLVVGTCAVIAEAVRGGRLTQLIDLVAVGQYCGLFVCGLALYLIREGARRFEYVAVLGAVQATFAQAMLGRWDEAVVVAVVCVFFAFVALRPDSGILTSRLLIFFGAISYPLYLVHQNLGYLLLWNLYPKIGPWASTCTALGVAIALAWLIHELVEVRFARWLKPHLRSLFHV